MTDVVLSPISSGYNLSIINANFTKVQQKINEEMLHLTGGNNTMLQQLDMNNNKLINVFTDPNDPNSLVTVGAGDSRWYNVAGDTLTGTMNAGGQRIVNLPAPTSDTEPMRRADVLAIDSGNALQLRLDLANPTIGGSIVGFLGSGVGSVPRTVSGKLQEISSPKDKGAVGDGVADDRTPINSVNATGLDVQTPSGIYRVTNTLTYGAATYRSGRAATYNSSATFSYRLNSGAVIDGGVWNATGGIAFDALSGATGVSIHDLTLNNTSVANATGVNMNATGIKKFRIVSTDIKTNGYGVLTNSGGTVDGLIVATSYIESGADCIELNAPGVSHKNIAIIGNVLRANGPGTSHASGFPVGIAAAKNVSVVANVIQEATWEAVHIEDQSDTLTVTANVAENCHGDFVRVQNGGIEGRTGGGGLPIVANNAKSFGAGLNNYGAYLVYDVAGSVQGMTLAANRFYGFSVGLTGGRADAITAGNVLDSCGSVAVQSSGGGFIHGENLTINTPTLAKSTEGTILGTIHSTTFPSTILDTSSHVAGLIGTTLQGFSYRGKLDTLPGANTITPIDLFALPKVMCGRLIVRIKSGNAYIYGSADLLWDGTTLTVTRTLKDQSGVLAWSGTTFTAVGGQLRMQVQNAGAVTLNVLTDVKFDGEYYK